MKIFFSLLFLIFSLVLIVGASGDNIFLMGAGGGGIVVTGLIVRALVGNKS